MLAIAGCVQGGNTAAFGANQRIDLQVLVVSDGSPTVEAIAAELTQEGVPYTRVSLTDPNRPTITSAFLSGTAPTGPEAYYESVVLPNDAPAGLSTDELTALAQFETTFGVRQVDSFVYPNAGVGLNTPIAPNGWAGTLDGQTMRATSAGLGWSFSYLAGPVLFDNNDPNVSESYGYLSKPLANTSTQSFTTLVDGSIPGTTSRGSIIGAFKQGTREQMVITIAANAPQSQFQYLAHGIITWMTRGVHLGYDRNYFTVHVDDIFNDDMAWSVTGHCTPGEDCTQGETTRAIRMKPVDVQALVDWEAQNNLTLTMVYNGDASNNFVAANGSYPLLNALVANANRQPWINHTYGHEFLGCIQNFTVLPWQCTTDSVTGEIQWLAQADIQSQITQNSQFAQAHGIPINATELVTGEHSGLFVLPQQPVDNPNFAPALTATGILVTASDNSRDPLPRQVGSALTVPRFPMAVYFNASTRAEAVSEYNWIYTSQADGGSGYCTQHPDITTCITPLDPNTGFTSYIVPLEARIDMFHILTGDPRPHYAHQSNITDDRLLYLVLNNILSRYRSTFASNTPIVQPTFTEDSRILSQQTAWKNIAPNTVSAYYLNGRVTIESASGTTNVPITVPTGSKVGSSTGPAFGQAYEGELSSWTLVASGSPLAIVLPPGS